MGGEGGAGLSAAAPATPGAGAADPTAGGGTEPGSGRGAERTRGSPVPVDEGTRHQLICSAGIGGRDRSGSGGLSQCRTVRFLGGCLSRQPGDGGGELQSPVG